MSDARQTKRAPGATEFSQQVGEKAARKLKAQRHVTQTVWSGLGMMGLIGWSVAVPTLLGAALGLFVDTHAAGHWIGPRLRQCVALGCQGGPGNTRARGRQSWVNC
jgi:ATP synthase protein I